jgi:SAM-dependent methyltransferase
MDEASYQRMREVEDRHWWFTSRRVLFAEILSIHLEMTPGTVVDVGCGTGGNLPFLARFGPVFGIESHPEAARLAAERDCGEVLSGSLPDRLPLAPASVDLVTLLDVLEHVEEERAALEALHRVLAEGGMMLVSVPALPALYSEHDRRLGHYRRYTGGELRARLLEAGFQVEYLNYINSWLLPIVAPLRLLSRWLDLDLGATEESLPPAPINSLLGAVFSSERYFIRQRLPFPLGLSLVALARKP